MTGLAVTVRDAILYFKHEMFASRFSQVASLLATLGAKISTQNDQKKS